MKAAPFAIGAVLTGVGGYLMYQAYTQPENPLPFLQPLENGKYIVPGLIFVPGVALLIYGVV